MLSNVDKVAAEICHELANMTADHEKQLRSIQSKYSRLHGQTAVLAVAAAGVALMPALAPFLGAAVPLALAVKYGKDKSDELAEKRALTQSLVGVLATAASNES
jgi:adenine/guanine phosphoribosyltransferase-like PRPP-binding protein